jgi:Membrane bound O-acyl transferase family
MVALMALPFPASLFLLPAAVLLGVGHVTLGRWAGERRRIVARATVLAVTWSMPLFIGGPGPTKLTIGLLVGFAGIRMVALGERWRVPGHTPTPGRIALAMVSLEELFARVPGLPAPSRGASLATAARGLVGLATCIALVFAGSRWQIWRASRLGDDLLVLVEVAIGAAGIHRLIVGGGGLLGRSVAGLQDHPLRSASLVEFWGRRWNRLVELNLDRAFFRPWSRLHHPRRGVLAAFTASGIMHAIAVADAAHPRTTLLPALAVMAFFWLHAGAVLAERWSGVHRAPPRPFPRLVARARTVALFALLSPLLLDPFAAVVHLHGRG